jgi:hypothetical protein
MGDLQLVYLFNIVIFHSYVSCDFELGISCVRSVFLMLQIDVNDLNIFKQ